jgi:hypothetical protein
MTYKSKLLPWCIIRTLPNKHSQVIIRLRRRQDAEAHLQILRANNPTASYELIFDVTLERTDSTGKQKLYLSLADRE